MEGEIFGVEIQNQNIEIGSVYIFCDSMANLLQTKDDEAPILNNQGDPCGTLKYSILVEGKGDDGSPLNMLHVENIQTLLG